MVDFEKVVNILYILNIIMSQLQRLVGGVN